MKNNSWFITGISTEVGKTVAAAMIARALEADYWKPVQAGDLDNTDSDKVRRWLTGTSSVIHPEAHRLNTPMSPHAAAAIDKVTIDLEKIQRPKSDKDLVIEGAGGLLVPLNDTDTIADLIQPDDKVILVSRHYLGSINHTLSSIESIRSRGLNLFGVLFMGEEHPTTEAIIQKMGQVKVIGRIDWEPYIDEHVVAEYAEKIAHELN
ncbi:dethiobiotin synthase [Aureitalea marina]|uniref:ATP-dependent dethiobiotin synthetase BioD n=1 Tax=Aureitalea marina TaxID=930804 RepID=A0A2S7KSQ9_9FLAO|nr:dethiobiotin synthase [Aureitalea marina]PQB05669.1 dethiobiotin synthase [Aureitalea marina]